MGYPPGTLGERILATDLRLRRLRGFGRYGPVYRTGKAGSFP